MGSWVRVICLGAALAATASTGRAEESPPPPSRAALEREADALSVETIPSADERSDDSAWDGFDPAPSPHSRANAPLLPLPRTANQERETPGQTFLRMVRILEKETQPTDLIENPEADIASDERDDFRRTVEFTEIAEMSLEESDPLGLPRNNALTIFDEAAAFLRLGLPLEPNAPEHRASEPLPLGLTSLEDSATLATVPTEIASPTILRWEPTRFVPKPTAPVGEPSPPIWQDHPRTSQNWNIPPPPPAVTVRPPLETQPRSFAPEEVPDSPEAVIRVPQNIQDALPGWRRF